MLNLIKADAGGNPYFIHQLSEGGGCAHVCVPVCDQGVHRCMGVYVCTCVNAGSCTRSASVFLHVCACTCHGCLTPLL